MGRPRKIDALTTTISGRIRPEQDAWLRFQADRRFEGEMGRTLRWALDQAEVFSWILSQPNPVLELDMMLNPDEPPDREDEIAEAEREYEQWKRDQAVKRAQRRNAKS